MLLKRQPAAGARVVRGQLKDLRSSTLRSSLVLHNSSSARTKGRPADNPLIVHVSDLDMLAALYPAPRGVHPDPSSCSSSGGGGGGARSQRIADIIPQQYHRLISAFWPGPLTILLPASPLLPAAVTAGQPTVAVRMPAHPVARALIAAAGVPLAAPSANTSGRPSPTSAQHVLDDLAGRVPAVVDGGGCGFGVESTVLDGLRVPPVVLRPGGVTAEQLAAAPEMAGLQVYARHSKSAGSDGCGDGSSAIKSSSSSVVVLEYVLGSWQQPELVAQQLFGALRAADDAGAGVILVQGLPPVGTGLAVMNRLQKAASRRVSVDL
ncbi:hypothetical protein OEZ86_003695 [Tetradesmus obliquus]|nr:hypothetical protein OEZ86_003695 [Tetradesmus obliquus]